MQSAQQLYQSTVCHLSSDEQLRLASLILEGVTQAQSVPGEKNQRQSVLDILAELPGRRIFKTSAEVDAYLREERDSWER